MEYLLSRFTPRSIIVTIAGGFIGLGILLWLISLLFSPTAGGTLTVNAPDGAEIFAASSRSEEFIKIGTTKATFSVSVDGPVFIEVRDGDRVTRYGEYLSERDTKEVSLSLDPQKETNSLYGTGFIDTFPSSNTLIYGISPQSGTVDNFRTDGVFEPPRIDFIAVPFVDEIAWSNKNKFTFESQGRVVGTFASGATSETDFIDLSQHATTSPLVLLDALGSIHLSKGSVETRLTQNLDTIRIVGIEAGEQHIHLLNEPTPAEYASDEAFSFNIEDISVTEDGVDDIFSDITLFDYEGNRVASYSVAIGGVLGVGSNQDRQTIAVSSFGFHFIDDQTYVHPMYGTRGLDVTEFNNEIYILNNDGVWRFDTNERSLKLVTSIENNQRGAAQSLDPNSRGLLFTTVPDEESSDSRNARSEVRQIIL